MKNVVLIGMPGAGKSTLGVLLAKTFKMPFIDTDLLIQEKSGLFLQEIIEKAGIEAFLSVEEEVILQLNAKGCIIATGGSVVLREKAILHLKKNGLLLYLELPLHEIERRIRNITTRGIAMNKSQTLLEVFTQRTPMYEKYADITIRCMDKSLEQIVEETQDILSNTV